MHRSSYLRMEYLLNYYRDLWEKDNTAPINVLDIGSCDQNGTYKELFQDVKVCYMGLDMSIGPNVDIVPKDIYTWNEIKSETYDLVISGQVFEHIEYPWMTMKEIERILRPSGLCIIIAPNAGIEHKAPLDCYRFFADGLKALAKWAGLMVLHVGVAGVPFIQDSDEWVSDWNDSTLVAQKEPISPIELEDPFIYERRRMIDGTISDMYKSLDIAVCENKKRFSNDKKYILFGAGVMGERMIKIIGEDNVHCFADNSAEKQGKILCGKMVISYDDFKQISKDYNCLITAPYNVSAEIGRQLKADNISYGTLYPVC